MDWEQVTRIRQAQEEAKQRIQAQEQITEEAIREAINSASFRALAAPDLNKFERMIFKMRTELIDWIVAHGLVQGFVFGGNVVPLVDGKIVITDEMIAEAAGREGFLDSAQATVLIQKYLTDNDYVSDGDYVHTDNNFTDALLEKLNGIDSGAEVNRVDDVFFNGVSVLDEDTKIAAITITAAQIKQWYESNPDTNAFTDAEQTKLAGIAPGAEVNRVDDVLVDGRSVMDMNKKALITKEIIKAAYEANENTNAFTDDEKTGLALLVQWKPQVDQEIIEIKRKHMDDFIELQGEIKSVSDKFTASTVALHNYINQVNEGLQELEQKEHDDYQELSTMNANLSAAIAELRTESRDGDLALGKRIDDLKAHSDSGIDELKTALAKESAARLANVSALQVQIDSNTSQITDIKSAIEDHDESIKGLTNGLSQTNDRLTADEVLLHNTISGMTNISSQVMSLMNWKPEVDEKLSGIETEQGEVMADITKIHQDIEDEAVLREEYDNMLKAGLDSANVNISSLMITASSMMVCCSAVKAQIEALETDVESNTTDINAIKQQLGGQGLKLLWENPNPTSSFSPQEIVFDEQYGGDYITILYGDDGTARTCSGISGNYLTLQTIYRDNQGSNSYILIKNRVAFYDKTNNKVTFYEGVESDVAEQNTLWHSNNGVSIPFCIYGGIGTPGAGTGGNSDIQIDTLWENASPTSDFNATNLTIDNLSEYKLFEIGYNLKTNNPILTSFIRTANEREYVETYSMTQANDYIYVACRRCKIFGNAVTFSEGRRQTATMHGTASSQIDVVNNSFMIPVYIKGIKIVGGGSNPYGDLELLWENPSPDSEFINQDIPLAKEGPEFILAVFKDAGGGNEAVITLRADKNAVSAINVSGNTEANMRMRLRRCSYRTTRKMVSVATGYISDTQNILRFNANDNILVPIAFYGLKAPVVSSARKRTVIWTNPNPGNDYMGGTVNFPDGVDSDNEFLIEILPQKTTNVSETVTIVVSGIGSYISQVPVTETSQNGTRTSIREIGVTKTGINFGDATLSTSGGWQARNEMSIPVKISVL